MSLSLASGTRLGPYEVVAPLGAGGMGEVYRAKDTKLNRDVAIKVLPESFAIDTDRVARFTREAQVLASLNHPNIAAIYGIEEQGGTRALVMELVEGRDLSEVIADGRSRGPSGPRMDLAEVLAIARQIADALEAAHERGIVHRDLKPQNIKVTADGTVKVLDFGLAKSADATASSPDLANSPTMTSPAMTAMGMILGTAAYMSPEQAKGRAVDKRADIWAFGVVLYEMVAGQGLFAAETVSESIAAVLTREPDWSRVPLALRPLIQSCLQKDPRKRLRDLGDIGLLLDGATGAAPTDRRRSTWPWAVAAVVVTAAITWWLASTGGTTADTEMIAFHEPAPAATQWMSPPRLSPDGRHVALIAAAADGRRQIWVRALSNEKARPVEGTDDATVVFWSPDSAELGFVANGEVRRVAIVGGPPTRISAHAATFAVWTNDGELVLAGPFGIVREPVGGGAARVLLKERSGTYSDLALLPPGNRVLLRQFGGETGLYVLNLADETMRKVDWDVNVLNTVGARLGFMAPDVLYYRRQQGTVVGRRLNLDTLVPAGEEFTIAEGVGDYASGDAGAISFIPGTTLSRLTWRDRKGRSLSTIGPEGQYGDVQLSHDGRSLLFTATDPTTGNMDLWIQALTATAPNRLTTDPGVDHNARFSPDDREVVWEGHRDQNLSVFRRRSDGSEEARLVRNWNRSGGPDDWSPDGSFVLYSSSGTGTRNDLWVLPMRNEAEPSLLVSGEFSESEGALSPDGRWLAYVSDATGREEIYLQRLEGTRRVGGPQRVSSGGAARPMWRRDGAELFYMAPAAVMAVKITPASDRPAGSPEVAFPVAAPGPYAVSPDGQRFVFIEGVGQEKAAAVIIKNWRHADKRPK